MKKHEKLRDGFAWAGEEERRKHAVPPAYTHVQVSTDPDAPLQVVAWVPVTQKPFYRYHPAAVVARTQDKWERVARLHAQINAVSERIAEDCLSGLPVAVTAKLILLTGMRVGNPGQAVLGEDAFGATNLLRSHARVEPGGKVIFDFPGKKGVAQHFEVVDHTIADWVRAVPEGRIFPHEANAVLRYLKKIGADKAHDLRTWRANVLAEELVRVLTDDGTSIPPTAKAQKALRKAVGAAVGTALGNTGAQALSSYINPRVFTAILPLSLEKLRKTAKKSAKTSTPA